MVFLSILMNAYVACSFSIYNVLIACITIDCTSITRIIKCISIIFRCIECIDSIVYTVSKVHQTQNRLIVKSAVLDMQNKYTYMVKLKGNASIFLLFYIVCSKIIFNHGFIGLPLTFSVLNAFFSVTQFSTSGTLEINKHTCFWSISNPLFRQCFLNEKIGVISKFFHSIVKKDLYFQTIISVPLFYNEKYGFFEFEKLTAFFKRGSSSCQSLSRALYRTPLYAPY